MKREGSTQASKLARQERVQRLFIKGLNATEISRVESIDIRTVQRDIQEITSTLMQIVPTQRLRTLKSALTEADEISRNYGHYTTEPPAKPR